MPVEESPVRRAGHRAWWLAAGAAALLLLAAVLLVTRSEGGRQGPRDAARPTPVRAATVERGALSIYTEYPGELVGEVSDLAPKVPGLLREVRVRIGDTVGEGDVIAIIDDTDLRRQLEEARGQLGVALANERRAQAELDAVESELRRSADLFREEVLSEQDFDLVMSRAASARANLGAAEAQIAQARARTELLEQQLADTRVLAPFPGTVATRYLDPGALVQPGTPIVRLVEKGRLVVQFRVPERDLGAIREGVQFTLTTQATSSQRYSGHVERISGEVSRSDRTAVVEGTMDEAVEILRPGMYAQVRVRVDEIDDAKIVPGVAVLSRVGFDGIERTGLFTVSDEGTAVWNDIEVRGRSENRVAIRGDVELGERVLTLGHEQLQEGSPITIVEQDPT